MTTKPEEYLLNGELTLWAQPQLQLSLAEVLLKLVWKSESLQDGKADRPIECRLTFQVTPAQYQQVDTQALFNLKPELRSSPSNGDFQADCPIEITATLQPDLLPQLTEFTTGDEVIAHLKNLAETQPDHPLLDTENWYALQVKQTHAQGETGYRTLWDYVNPAVIAQGELSSEEITDRMVQFFRDWIKANPTDLSPDSLEASLDQITQPFDEWLETSFAEGETVVSEAIDQVATAFDELIDGLNAAVDDLPTDQSIYQTMIQFFTEDDWSFTKLQGEPVLRMRFQGENGEWACYAKARKEQEQFVFYSICPIASPEDKRMAIAHFLTLANYGTIIGNFELDYIDGEIRYKTSIDVEGDRLTSALIKRLVYTNVTMMDEYLPGIQAVLAGQTPASAIQSIELPHPSISPPSASEP